MIRDVPRRGCVVEFLQRPADWVGAYSYSDPDTVRWTPMGSGQRHPRGTLTEFHYYANVLLHHEVDAPTVVVLRFSKQLATELLAADGRHGGLLGHSVRLTTTVRDVAPVARKIRPKLLDIETELRAASRQNRTPAT